MAELAGSMVQTKSIRHSLRLKPLRLYELVCGVRGPATEQTGEPFVSLGEREELSSTSSYRVGSAVKSGRSSRETEASWTL